MSLFIIPTLDARQTAQPYQRRTVTGGNRCGSPAVRSPFDLLFGANHFADHPFAAFDHDDDESRFAAYEARLRHQQQVEERRLQERYAALRRQAEIERERERRRIRAHQEQQQRRRQAAALSAAAAAHAAWQEEQERQVRAALEKQRQRRQQEALAAAERQRAWQQRQAQEAAARRHRQHSYDDQVAAAVAQEQWEEVAKQGLAVAFEFAKNLFGLEEEEEGDNDMEVDQQGKSNVAGPSSSPAAAAAAAATQSEDTVDKDMISSEDPPEVVPTETAEEPQQKLVFTHPLPSDASQRAAIKADDIQVHYDDQSRSIVIRGLWQDNHVDNDTASSDGHTVTSSDDEEQSRGRKRSRSPKRSRVSDVDEKTGEEIVSANDTSVDADGFVNVSAHDAKGKQAQGSTRIPVPEGASVSGLRAELTDDGFQVWL